MASADFIRTAIREDGKLERKERRENLLGKNRRALGEVERDLRTITKPEEVSELAAKLKQRGGISFQELCVLKHAFLHSQDNIAAFLRVNGALHSVVRELTGADTQRQLAAAAICCNLGLGKAKFCRQISKAAGPYLIPSLDGLNTAFVDICVWTLGNLAGGGLEAWHILKSQGALPKLTSLLTSFSDDIQRSAIYALTHFVKNGFDNLEAKELVPIANHVCTLLKKEASVYWLLFLLSCSPECCAIFVKNHVVSEVFKLLNVEVSLNSEERPVKTTALVRSLANMCAAAVGSGELLYFEASDPDVLNSTLGSLLTSPYPHVQRETLWLVGNVVNCYGETSPRCCQLLSGLHHQLSEAVGKAGVQ